MLKDQTKLVVAHDTEPTLNAKDALFTNQSKTKGSTPNVKDISLISQNNTNEPTWTLYVNNSLNVKKVRARIALTNLEEHIMEHSSHFSFQDSNNEIEYEALMTSLTLDRLVEAREINANNDS